MNKYYIKFFALNIFCAISLIISILILIQERYYTGQETLIAIFVLCFVILIFFIVIFYYYKKYISKLIKAKKTSIDCYNDVLKEFKKQETYEKDLREQESIVQAEEYKANQANQKAVQEKFAEYSKAGKICCPKCGSENVTGQSRGYSIVTGFIGSGNVRLSCLNCGERWKPGHIPLHDPRHNQ